MILSACVLLLCLMAGANASAIKGRHEQPPELGTKRLGLVSPVELRRNQQATVDHLPLEHRELSKTNGQEEQRREEKLEDLGQQREETNSLTQIKEQKVEEQLAAVKAPLRAYEAKPQLRGDDLAKGQPAGPLSASKTHQVELERREESLVQMNEKHEELLSQQREELLKSTETNRRTEQQVVDLKSDLDQQRRLEADQPIQQVQQQARYEEPLFQQQQQQQEAVQQEEQRTFELGDVKGARSAFAEAEPYAFDYSIEGSSRRETGDVHGVVRGQYTVLNGDGSQRVVDYIADRDGFRAQVNTGELGTENQQPASVLLRSSQPAAQDISLRLEGKTREFLTAVPQAPAAPLTKTVARPDNWNIASGSGKTAWEPQQAQRKGGSEWDSWQPASKRAKEPELIKEERAPILIPNQPIKSTVQRIEEEEAPLKQEILKQEPPKEEPLKQEQLKQEALKQEPPKEELALGESPAKKAELTRTPKAIAELRSSPVIQARASFESATAHRPIVHSLQVAPVATHQHHHRQQPVVHRHHAHHHLVPAHHRVHVSPPVRTYQLAHGALPSRAQLQYDRYPPQPLNPRVSFYSASNFDDEQPAAAGFEHPINSS